MSNVVLVIVLIVMVAAYFLYKKGRNAVDKFWAWVRSFFNAEPGQPSDTWNSLLLGLGITTDGRTETDRFNDFIKDSKKLSREDLTKKYGDISVDARMPMKYEDLLELSRKIEDAEEQGRILAGQVGGMFGPAYVPPSK